MFSLRDVRMLWSVWLLIALGLLAAAVTLFIYSDLFAWSLALIDIPSVPLAIGGIFAGVVYVNLAWLIPLSERLATSTQLQLLGLIILVGLALRLIMLMTTPALESDFYRYHWDGGVVAAGFNPFAFAPQDAHAGMAGQAMQQLAFEAGAIVDRINHAELKTIYPPVAQLWFAVAHWLEPWSLNSLRLLSLAFEATALALLLRMLAACGRSLLWVALYWWNPIVIKELSNSLHMEFMLLPIVLAALLLAIRGRHIASVLALAVAVGTKVWPVLLLPLLLRPLSRQPARITAAVIIFALVCACWAIPIVLSGLDDTSGFVAFAKRWQTNSALFQSLNPLVASIGHMIALTPETSGLVLRGLLAAIAGLVGLLVALEHTVSPLAFVQRAALVVGALFLLSPAQFPWYGTWVICLLPFVPLPGLLAMTVTLPIYYVSFHLAAVHRYDIFNTWFLWVIWIPVWLLLARDALGIWRRPLEWKSDAP